MELIGTSLPPQQLPYSQKNKKWRKQHLDWADSKACYSSGLVRKSVRHKKINYDLYNMKIHMDDMRHLLNPDNMQADYIPDKIQHYPITNNKLHLLKGEELARVFDYRVVVTNPNAISEIEREKRDEAYEGLKGLVESSSVSEEDFERKLADFDDYLSYEWQDMREVRAGELLNHYMKEYNLPAMFADGFMDALIVAEEIYQCDIVGGEPVIERLNPLKVHAFRSGYSSRIEDADMIIIEDYWSPGRVIDTYYDVLSSKDIKALQNENDFVSGGFTDSAGNIDERYGHVNMHMMGEEFTGGEEGFYWDPFGDDSLLGNALPYDSEGNVRVLRVYWKSRRKIRKVKSYNEETGEEEFHFYPETYKVKKELGEEEEVYWINEAWEGTKIGKDIYVNMRPRPIQYNRLSNPSRCHFGIIGSVYNVNDSRPVSMVDILKPYNYLYDAVHDRLNKLIARNWGKIIKLDLAMVPQSWDIDKWMYYARVNNIAVVNSFNEGNKGAATGKLAGALNNNSNGVIDAETGGIIQQNLALLSYIKDEMSEACGISRQREGQISNRETVGGVERSTLQSSHITEWIFSAHDNLKKRVLECFLETAKIAMKGRQKKFEYITSDGSRQLMTIDGDEFSECDYGLVVDNSNGLQQLNQQIETLAQAALQNQLLNFSTVMKLYSSSSLSEKMRMIQNQERKAEQRQQQAQEQAMQQQQQQLEANAQMEQAKMQQQDNINQRDNQTRIEVAKIEAMGRVKSSQVEAQAEIVANADKSMTEKERQSLQQQSKEFDAKMKLEQDKLNQADRHHQEDDRLKRYIANRKGGTK